MESGPRYIERSKRLHNFNLPYLRWGQQKFLRCVNLPPNSNHRSSSSSSPDRTPNRSVAIEKKTKNGEGAVAERPWNLRTRRAACNEPGDESPGKKIEIEEMEKDEKLKFSVSLLREEIEEDFSSIIGKRPPRRPKKRPRLVQKKLNTIFPGLWLDEEVTMESYSVPESLET